MKLISILLILAMLTGAVSGELITAEEIRDSLETLEMLEDEGEVAGVDATVAGEDVRKALEMLDEKGIEVEDFTLRWKDGQGALGEAVTEPTSATPTESAPTESAPVKLTPTDEQWADYLDLKKALGGGGMVAALSMELSEFLTLADADFATVKEKITTITDCLYLLRVSGFAGTSSIRGNSTSVAGKNASGKTVKYSLTCFPNSPEQTWAAGTGDRAEVAHLIAALLEGDYDEVGYVYTYRVADNGSGTIARMFTTYVRDGEMTHTFNGGQFAEGKSLNYRVGKDFDDVLYREYTRTFTSMPYTTRFIIACADNGEGFVPFYSNNKNCFTVPDAYLDRLHVVMETPTRNAELTTYTVSESELEKLRTPVEAVEAQKQNADTAIRQMASNSPVQTRGLTLSWAEAEALAEADLATVKEKVKTLEDCIYYYAAVGRRQLGGDIEYRPIGSPDDVSWHFNFSPQMVFVHGFGDCGGNAALVYYLLEGDYDEIGYITMARDGGGHITNYIRDGAVYYTLDMNQFAGNTRNGINFHASYDLNEAAIAGFGKNYSAICTYTGCNDGDAPIGWSQETGGAGGTQHFITGYAEKINIVKEDPKSGCVYKFVEVGQEVLDIIHLMRNQD